MLPVEQEPIKLPRIESEVDVPDGKRVTCIRGHDQRPVEFTVPRKFIFLWDQVKIGASLYDLALRLRARGTSNRVFLDVSSFLSFLVDHDLVDDMRLVRIADSIRGEYEWPNDVIATVSFRFPLAQWARAGTKWNEFETTIFSRAFDVVGLLAVAICFPAIIFAMHFLYNFIARSTHLEPLMTVFKGSHLLLGALVGLLFGGIFGRSWSSLMRLVASRLSREAGAAELKIDLLGPHLDFQPHTVTGGLRRSADFFMVYSSLMMPLLVLWSIKQWNLIHFGDLLVAGPSLMVFLSASLLVSTIYAHPATASALTKSLRVWNRTPLVWREDDELKEVESFFQLGSLVSHLIMLAVLVSLGLVVGLSWDSSGGHAVSLLTLAIALVFLGIYIEPFFSFQHPDAARLNRRRRMWATKVRVLEVAVADREAWAQLPVMRQLTPQVRSRLLANSRVVEFASGKAVCRQGGTDRSLFIVLDGKLAVAKSFDGRRRKVVAILSKGSVFGETAFFFGTPRTADVVAMEKCSLLEVRYFEGIRNLDLSSSEEFQFRVWLLQALSGNSMLKDLPIEAMDTLIFAGRRRFFKAGEVVFTEGAPGDSCYFIAQGQASAVQQAKKINEMGAGDAFGEIALLKAGSARTATVVADSDLLCMELDAENFWTLMAARLPLGAEIERLALRRLRADEQRRAISQ